MEINSSMAIGYVFRQLAEEGITDIETIASKLDELKGLQNQRNLWSYDRFTESGSSAAANVITESSNQSKACILWCLNHYLGLNRHPRVIARAKEALDKFGTGCGTSAMSGGMSALHKEIEKRLEKMLG